MFDIGFTELLLLSIMALLVLGPDRLPVAVKTIALWLGRFKRSWNKLRSEIEKEIGADDIRQQLHNEQILKDLGEDTRKLQENFQQGFQSIEHDLKDLDPDTSPASESLFEGEATDTTTERATEQPKHKPGDEQ